LRRTIQRDILNPLAIQMLESSFGEGGGIEVDLEGGVFVFHEM
jgi:ATP-dependent Clp protease ATP-binding subunit ClpA